MTVRDYVTQTLQTMNEAELAEVADYLAFLRFRARSHTVPALDKGQLQALYAESAPEDRNLAEEGMAEYASGLVAEDSQ